MSVFYKFSILFILFLQSAFAETSGLAFDANKPIEVVADKLTVDDITHQGYFSGSVNIKQGDFHLSSNKVTIFYDKTAKNKKAGRIKKFIASDHVLISSPTEKIKSDKATYHMAHEEITLEGNILLTREDAILSGDSAILNLKTRHIDIQSSPKKRIYSVIYLDKLEK